MTARDTRKDAMKTMPSCILLLAKGYRTMTSGWQGAPRFRRYGRESVSKPAISLNRSSGGATVVRLGPPYISKTVVSKIGFVTYIYDNGRSCDYYPKKRFEMAGFLKSFNIDLTIQVFLQKKKFFTFLVPQGHSCHFSLETSSFFLRK